MEALQIVGQSWPIAAMFVVLVAGVTTRALVRGAEKNTRMLADQQHRHALEISALKGGPRTIEHKP